MSFMGLVFKTIEFLKKFGILCLEFFNGTFEILHLVYVFCSKAWKDRDDTGKYFFDLIE